MSRRAAIVFSYPPPRPSQSIGCPDGSRVRRGIRCPRATSKWPQNSTVGTLSPTSPAPRACPRPQTGAHATTVFGPCARRPSRHTHAAPRHPRRLMGSPPAPPAISASRSVIVPMRPRLPACPHPHAHPHIIPRSRSQPPLAIRSHVPDVRASRLSPRFTLTR